MFQPPSLQIVAGGENPSKLAMCEPPFETRLHQMLQAFPGLFADEWLWVGAQIRSTAGRIIDLIAIDGSGHIYGVNAHRRLDGPSALCDALASLCWLEALTPCDIDAMALGYRGESLAAAFAERFDRMIPSGSINSETGLVIVVPDRSRAREASRTLRRHGVNVWIMELVCFGESEATVCAFKTVE